MVFITFALFSMPVPRLTVDAAQTRGVHGVAGAATALDTRITTLSGSRAAALAKRQSGKALPTSTRRSPVTKSRWRRSRGFNPG